MTQRQQKRDKILIDFLHWCKDRKYHDKQEYMSNVQISQRIADKARDIESKLKKIKE